MSKQLSAHLFKPVYQDLGYDLSKLGCIMYSLDSAELEKEVSKVVTDKDAYFTESPDRFWINGIVANKAHVTILYGLLRSGNEMKKHVDTMIGGLDIKNVEVDYVSVFDSPYEDESYYCIVAHLKITPELQEAHDRLTFLPHINTFPGYKAHCTLAYIKPNNRRKIEIIGELDTALKGKKLAITGIDYGSNKR